MTFKNLDQKFYLELVDLCFSVRYTVEKAKIAPIRIKGEVKNPQIPRIDIFLNETIILQAYKLISLNSADCYTVRCY